MTCLTSPPFCRVARAWYYHTVGELAYQCPPAPSPYHQLPKLIAIIVIGICICIPRHRTLVTVSSGARPCLSCHRRRLRPVHLAQNKALSLLHPGRAVSVPDSPTLIAHTAKVSRSTKSPAPSSSSSTPEKSPPRPATIVTTPSNPPLPDNGGIGGRQTNGLPREQRWAHSSYAVPWMGKNGSYSVS